MAKGINGLDNLDANQVIRKSSVDLAGGGTASGVVVLNSLVPDEYDQVVLTYIASGDGAGEVGTATYKLAGIDIAILTLTYDASSRLTDVIRS